MKLPIPCNSSKNLRGLFLLETPPSADRVSGAADEELAARVGRSKFEKGVSICMIFCLALSKNPENGSSLGA